MVEDNFLDTSATYTIYMNPIESVNATTKIVKQAGCDMIICLSHLGVKYEDNKVSDEVLAKNCYDIDLIIGGLTHRFLANHANTPIRMVATLW
ncbi:MAG: hypothetical protein QM541_14275 [Flavobacterium sp.]|nr:hypothetical protein [Flavobacterium sp.]